MNLFRRIQVPRKYQKRPLKNQFIHSDDPKGGYPHVILRGSIKAMLAVLVAVLAVAFFYALDRYVVGCEHL